jgi:HCOMODA/2-hydroxy-3-carboxy-muconic semialdehyde decarboxylase
MAIVAVSILIGAVLVRLASRPLIATTVWLGVATTGWTQVPATTASSKAAVQIADVVLANHILVNQGVLDAFGHVSVRSTSNPNHYFISRSRAPALVAASDIMEYDLDDHPIDARGRSSYLERFIHSEIYRMRPEVQSIVHSHSAAVIPFSVTDVPLMPVTHMGGFLVRAVPVFEIRTVVGNDSDMLIKNAALGAALARNLGGGSAVLMRGHGMTVVGNSIKLAVLHAVYAEVNARAQANALQLSKNLVYLNEAEATRAGAVNDTQVDRPWDIWKNAALSNKTPEIE